MKSVTSSNSQVCIWRCKLFKQAHVKIRILVINMKERISNYLSSVFTSLPNFFNYVFHKNKHKQKVLINLCKLVSGIKFAGCWFWYSGNLWQTYVLYIVIFCLFQWPDWTTFDSGFFYNNLPITCYGPFQLCFNLCKNK